MTKEFGKIEEDVQDEVVQIQAEVVKVQKHFNKKLQGIENEIF